MNGSLPEDSPWSRQRWFLLVLVIFGLHLAALWLVSERTGQVRLRTEPRAMARWQTSPAGAQKLLDALEVSDPTLFAMVNTGGFSGAAWLQPPPPTYRASEWTDAQRWLAQPVQTLGEAFQHFATNQRAPLFEPARKPEAPVPTLAVRQPVLRERSRLIVEGSLVQRPLVQSPPLRSWPAADVLADTRVQVLVDADGLIFSPRLLSPGGVQDPMQRAADQHAIELTRALRFAPAPGRPTTSSAPPEPGTLVFQWHTTAPPAASK
jgi:hypothetical protein